MCLAHEYTIQVKDVIHLLITRYIDKVTTDLPQNNFSINWIHKKGSCFIKSLKAPET